jgi:hypothetical protein
MIARQRAGMSRIPKRESYVPFGNVVVIDFGTCYHVSGRAEGARAAPGSPACLLALTGRR